MAIEAIKNYVALSGELATGGQPSEVWAAFIERARHALGVSSSPPA
jgi:hypothetical protein